MSFEKISPAFTPFLAETGPHEKRDAIVVYRGAVDKELPVRGRLRQLRQRLQFIEAQARIQKPVQNQILQKYRKIGQKGLRASQKLEASAIGQNTLPVAHVEVTSNSLMALAEQDEVIAILPNQKVNLLRPKAVEYSRLASGERRDGLTWGLKHLSIPDLWNKSRGRDIKVAVLDTGVYGSHPVLQSRVEKFVIIDPLGNRITADKSFDCGQHGTHVCGTISGGRTSDGVAVGVAPEARLLVAGILLGDATLRSVMEGISWAVENGADIINLSLGFSYYEPKFDEVFNMLMNQYNVLPVVAIGNENHGNSSSPGNSPNCLAVGAVEKVARGKVQVASFSSGASLHFPDNPANPTVIKPDIAAPGVQIFSCIPPEKCPQGLFEHTYMDGTSMATPHVSGVAALLMAAKPEASAREILAALKNTAYHPGGNNCRPDNRFGYGVIRPKVALDALS